ncbi:MAG: hypothetical protein RSB88_00985 [Akkermansia sp.]
MNHLDEGSETSKAHENNERKTQDARQLMRQYYDWAGRELEADRELFTHCLGGIFWESHELCVVARPVIIDSLVTQAMQLPDDAEQLASCNAWYIHLMTGEMSILPAQLPFYTRYQFVCYTRGRRKRRGNNLRIAPVSSFFRGYASTTSR